MCWAQTDRVCLESFPDSVNPSHHISWALPFRPINAKGARKMMEKGMEKL